MKPNLIFTRPQGQTVTLDVAGVEVVQAPTHRVHIAPVTDAHRQAIDAAHVLILSSRNALDFLIQVSDAYWKDKLIYVPSSATALAVREAGALQVFEGGGDARGIIQSIKENASLQSLSMLYLRGDVVRVAVDVALREAGLSAQSIEAYRLESLPMSPDFVRAVAGESVIAVMSVRAGKQIESWLDETRPEHPPVAVVLSAAIAESLNPKVWARIIVADSPNMAALITALKELYAGA